VDVLKANFEEKQFESAFTSELTRGSLKNQVFSSGQVLEHILGYDAATNAGPDHVIWSVLGAPRPRGVALLPTLWTPGQTPKAGTLPTSLVSLILQFKRPEFMSRRDSAQWHLWHGRYYRFHRNDEQHRILLRLESRLGGEAEVRYASPAFHKLNELEAAQITGTVISKTGFASPHDLQSHKVWTYQGAGSIGRGNPSGPRRPFPGFDSVVAELGTTNRGVAGRSLVSLLDSHAAAARARSPRLRQALDIWLRSVANSGVNLLPDTLAQLRAYVSVQSAVVAAQSTWWLYSATGTTDATA
jgi:hypothetical protein